MISIFADEAGNFDFSPKGSAYFIVAAAVMPDWAPIAHQIIALRFYQLTWHFLLQYVANRYQLKTSESLIVAGSLGTKSKKIRFKQALDSVVTQQGHPARTAFWAAASHPCLQVSDCCAWAIQRYYEKKDDRSLKLISSQVKSCFEPFRHSKHLYY